MESKVKLIIARHGESMGNVDEACYGDDSMNFLSYKGTQQAHELGVLMNGLNLDIKNFVCTNLTRSKQTLKLAMEAMGKLPDTALVVPELREQDFSLGDGSILAQRETDDELERRIKRGIHKLMNLQTDGNILVVMHANSMDCLWDCMKSFDVGVPDKVNAEHGFFKHCHPHIFHFASTEYTHT